MRLLQDSENSRRLLIAAGTETFENLDGFNLPLVPDELKSISISFADLGYERQHVESSLNPTSNQLLKLIKDVKVQGSDEDLIITYYTGHGANDDDRFYLLTQETDLDDLDGTSIPVEDITRALTKHAKASQILLILDVCYAGAGAKEVTQIVDRIGSKLENGPAVFVIAAARPKQEAEQGALSSALSVALQNNTQQLGGHNQKFLAIDNVMDSVDSYLRDEYPTQVAVWSSTNVRGGCRLFPNPGYLPEIHPGLDLETQRTFIEHWLPKARGTDFGSVSWYFTGRNRALCELAEWLSSERSDGRVRVVTGGPGCGKSAVLARIVTLADPSYRREALAISDSAFLDQATLPPEGVVSVAIQVRHKLLSQVVSEIAFGLGLAVHDHIDLLEAISSRQEKTVIVIDALDEASEKEIITSQLLRPLARLSEIFLLVGTRPDSTEEGKRYLALGESVFEIDLDDAKYSDSEDVTNYIKRRLLATEEPNRHTPYRNETDVASMVAQSIADRAGKTFLVAHIAVQAILAEDKLIDVNRSEWVEKLPTGLDDAFNQFLNNIDRRQPDGLTAKKVRSVLTSLAFAEGEGLPWVDLWRAVTDEISDSDISDSDIEYTRTHASAFIVEAVEQELSVYRLYHESLAEYLRSLVIDAVQVQKCFVKALCSRIPKNPITSRTDWQRAHIYLLRYLSIHAFKAGTLDELILDPQFLVAAEPETLLPCLTFCNEKKSKLIAIAYRKVSGRLRGKTELDRIPYLATEFLKDGLIESYKELSENLSSMTWMPLWADWVPRMPSHTICKGDSQISKFVVEKSELNDSRVLVGRDSGAIEIWNLTSGKLLDSWELDDPMGRVNEIAFADTLSGKVVIAAWSGGCLGSYNIKNGAKYIESISFLNISFTALCIAEYAGQEVCVTADDGCGLRVWELPSLKKIMSVPRATKSKIYCLNSINEGEYSVILSGGDCLPCDRDDDGIVSRLSIWRLEGLEKIWEDENKEHGVIFYTQQVEIAGHKLVVTSQDHFGPPEIWDFKQQNCKLFIGGMPTSRSWLYHRGDDILLISVSVNKFIAQKLIVNKSERVLSISTEEPYGEVYLEGAVFSEIVNLNGRETLLSSSLDHMKVWDIEEILSLAQFRKGGGESNTPKISCVSVDPKMPNILYAGTIYGDIVAMDAGTGKVNWSKTTSQGSKIISVIPFDDITKRCLLVGDESGVMYIFGTDYTEKPLHIFRAGDQIKVINIVELYEQPFAIASVFDQHIWAVRLWDLSARKEMPTLISTSHSKRWRYQLSHGQEDKVINGLSAIKFEDSIRIAFASKYGKVMIADFDLNDDTEKPFILDDFDEWDVQVKHNGYVSSLAIGRELGENILAVSSIYGDMEILNFSSGESKSYNMGCHLGQDVRALIFFTTEHQTLLISGGQDGVVRFWTTELKEVEAIELGEPIVDIDVISKENLAIVTVRGLLVVSTKELAAY